MEERVISWDELAEKYTESVGIEKTEIIYPAEGKILGDVRGKNILDLGCGFGVHAKILKGKGGHVIGVDTAQSMLEIGRSMYPDLELLLIKEREMPFPDETFDIVISDLVIMMIESKEKIQDIVNGIYRILKRGGIFLFSIPHPCFHDKDHFSYRNTFNPEFDYTNIGYSFGLVLKNPDGKEMVMGNVDFHYRIQDYLEILLKSGFKITIFEELSYPKDVIEKYKISKIHQKFSPYVIIGGEK